MSSPPKPLPRPQSRRILVVGDIMTDVVARLSGPIAFGSDTPAQIVETQGGSGANAAAWLAHFGVDVTLAARVGASDLGAQEQILRACGVTPALAADAARPTGRLIALVETGGERSFLTDRGANENLCAADLPQTLLDGTGHLHISGYAFFAASPRAAALALMQAAKARGIPVSIDPSSASFLAAAGPQNFLAWTSGADLCFPNEEEAVVLSGSGDPDAQLAVLMAHYPELVVKQGAAGAHVFTNGGQKKISCAVSGVKAIDTTGAGDAFLGAYLAARVAGKNTEFCLLAAAKAGAAAVRQTGGRPPARPAIIPVASRP